MKTLIPSILVTLSSILLSPVIFAENTAPCWKTPTLVAPLSQAQASDTMKLLPKDTTYNHVVNVYEADINNDGKPEEIFVLNNNGHTQVIAFEKTDQTLTYLGALPSASTPYTNTDGKEEFITKLCGKTYFSFAAGKQRDTYLWQGEAADDACDSDWIKHEKYTFKKLYTEHAYNQAIQQLRFYTDKNKCRNQIDSKLLSSIQKDLAVASIINH